MSGRSIFAFIWVFTLLITSQVSLAQQSGLDRLIKEAPDADLTKPVIGIMDQLNSANCMSNQTGESILKKDIKSLVGQLKEAKGIYDGVAKDLNAFANSNSKASQVPLKGAQESPEGMRTKGDLARKMTPIVEDASHQIDAILNADDSTDLGISISRLTGDAATLTSLSLWLAGFPPKSA